MEKQVAYRSLAVNVGEDCPVFEGMFNFFQISTGGSVGMGNIKLMLILSLHQHFCS